MITSQQHDQRSSGVAAASAAGAADDPAGAVSVGAARVAAAIEGPSATRGRDEWLSVVAHCQWLINTVTAVQDAAIAEAARRESRWCEDGTLGESVHGPGRVTLDAADVIAPVIGASHQQAERRVEQAVRLAAGRVPAPAEAREVPQASGLGGLHEAMVAGQLDGYRAGVVAFELEVAPGDVADAVVAALSAHFGDDSSSLRRRTRVLLSRISADLVRERARRARARTGLRRWVAEPGVDEWHGTFPSEDAASAWAAIDRLAHDLLAEGTCSTIEQARGKALTDLVTGNANVDVQIVLTVPADNQPVPGPPAASEGVGATEGYNPQLHTAAAEGERPTNVHQSASTAVDGSSAHSPAPTGRDDEIVASFHPPAPTTGGGGSTHAQASTATQDDKIVDGIKQSASGEPLVGAPDEKPTRAAPDTGVDCVHARADAGAGGGPAHAPPARAGCDEDLIEVQGSRPCEPLLVRRSWLREHLSGRPTPPRRGRPKAAPAFAACDPLTGARLDPDDDLTTDGYRPSAQLTALVKARDGRCRFPGCTIAARFCDLDHVRPWPTGPTAATNLLTLCRRHHRIKQRPGWRLHLTPDGTATWTDPTGRARTTAPLDALHTLMLPADPANPADPADPADPGLVATWSALEHHLTFRLEHHMHPIDTARRTHPTHRRCTSAAALRAGHARSRSRAQWPDEPPF